MVYASPIAAVANRLELCFALLLTSIAFKFVVSKSIPRISYLTTVVRHPSPPVTLLTSSSPLLVDVDLIDRVLPELQVLVRVRGRVQDVYILAGMLVQSLNCIWFAVVTNWIDWLDIRKFDIAALSVCAVGYILFHCVYIAWIYTYVRASAPYIILLHHLCAPNSSHLRFYRC